mgnify:CR=1 FL=1
MTARQSLADHWPEYLIEAWGLASFMLAAGVCVTLVEYPGSPLHAALGDPALRRALVGLAMGLTAIAIVYSPWGQRSGAHLNPAVTLTFWRLGKVAGWDALFYVLAQFAGGTLGAVLAATLLQGAFTGAPVHYAVTVPGAAGPAVAFAAELAISAALMFVILTMSNTRGWMRLTGLAAGGLVAAYIALEAPLSGMSMNLARTTASNLLAGETSSLWIYATAPLLGMLAAAAGVGYAGYTAAGGRPIGCPKLFHRDTVPCIFCGAGRHPLPSFHPAGEA